MTPVHCRTQGADGDCVRACVASILDRDWSDVPHFFPEGVAVADGYAAMSEWLLSQGFAPFYVGYDGGTALACIHDNMQTLNPDSHYILFGRTSDGADHAVVCHGGKIDHDPAWYRSPIVEASGDLWLLMVIGVR